MRKLILLTALALLGVLCAASAAPAKSRDHNHDRIPDRWERSHHLSLKVSQARRDQDRDGLNNRGEYRAKTDPRDADSDDDGVRDGSEHAGTIASFDKVTRVLTISLAGGGELAATVDEEGTEIECHGSARTSSGDHSGPGDDGDDADESRGDDDPADHDAGDDDPADHDAGDDHGDDDADHDAGDDHEHGDTDDGDDVNDHGDDDEDRCGTEALTAGTQVREAELKVTAAGKRWSELELTK